MKEYEWMVKRQNKWMLILLSIIIVLIFVIPQENFIIGLAVGAVVSYYNLWFLHRKITIQGQKAEKEHKRIGTGMLSRFATAVLGIIIVLKFDWSAIGYIFGLMTSYLVIVIDFLWFNRE